MGIGHLVIQCILLISAFSAIAISHISSSNDKSLTLNMTAVLANIYIVLIYFMVLGRT